MKNILLFLLITSFILACNSSLEQNTDKETIYISSIAFHSEEDVALVLGTPNATEETKNGTKKSYKDGRFEIVYIDGKADWITINDYWEDIDMSEIRSYVSVNTFDDYVYIKAKTR